MDIAFKVPLWKDLGLLLRVPEQFLNGKDHDKSISDFNRAFLVLQYWNQNMQRASLRTLLKILTKYSHTHLARNVFKILGEFYVKACM